jgi:hypothetical protein
MRTTASKKSKQGEMIIVKKMKDYSNDPVFRKKAEDAINFIKKHGLPDAFKKKGK